MKLKTNNASTNPGVTKKNKSPKKQGKGVEVRKEKAKEVVKPEVLKKEAVKANVVTPSNSQKLLQRELWNKAIVNVSKMSNLTDEEGNIVKAIADHKNVPQKSLKFKNYITKGHAKFKDTTDEVANGIFEKISKEYKALSDIYETEAKKPEKKVEQKPKKVASDDEEKMNIEGEDDDNNENAIDDDDNDDDDDNNDEEAEDIALDNSDDDIDNDEESEEEKPKPKAKDIKINNKKGGKGKGQANKANNGSKFKGGKVQKNKKFGKKK